MSGTGMREHAISKALSARWLCTLGAILIWAYLAWRGDLDSAFSASMIALVIKSYFDRPDRGSGGDG